MSEETEPRTGLRVRRAAPAVIAEVGGGVDESHLTLGVYSTDLQPEEISARLGCAPTRSHRRGEARRPENIPAREGAWLLTVEGHAPDGPDELARRLLERLPKDTAVWRELAATHSIRPSFGIFFRGWSRGFELSPASLRELAVFGVPVGFSIYADGEEA